MTTIQQQVRTAEQHLSAVDPVMADVLAKHGPCGLAVKRRDPFHTLCSSIISSSAERLVGKACVSPFRSRWSPYLDKKTLGILYYLLMFLSSIYIYTMYFLSSY